MSGATLGVFAYGSLMFAPERPDALIEAIPARLRGHRRAFNKRSVPRGCPADLARWPDVPVPTPFRTETHHLSLALGTDVAPSAEIDGRLLVYRGDAGVLADLDRREGTSEDWTPWDNSYRRLTVPLETDAGPAEALAYLGNPDSRWFAPLSVDEQARVLLSATPRPDGGRARGVDYLLGTRDVLRGGGVDDPDIEALVQALLALDGPWAGYLRGRV